MTAMKKTIDVKDDSSINKDDGMHAHMFASMHVCTHARAHTLARAYTLAHTKMMKNMGSCFLQYFELVTVDGV